MGSAVGLALQSQAVGSVLQAIVHLVGRVERVPWAARAPWAGPAGPWLRARDNTCALLELGDQRWRRTSGANVKTSRA
jgi:hypothetical protein